MVLPILDGEIMNGLEQDFTCPSCHKILCNTVVTACGTKICRYCLVIYLKTKKNCPICHKKCTDFLVYPKIDARIASIYKKVGPKFRNERQIFLNQRKILQQNFDIGKQDYNNNNSSIEEYNIFNEDYTTGAPVDKKKKIQNNMNNFDKIKKKDEKITSVYKNDNNNNHHNHNINSQKQKQFKINNNKNIQTKLFNKSLNKISASTGSLIIGNHTTHTHMTRQKQNGLKSKTPTATATTKQQHTTPSLFSIQPFLCKSSTNFTTNDTHTNNQKINNSDEQCFNNTDTKKNRYDNIEGQQIQSMGEGDHQQQQLPIFLPTKNPMTKFQSNRTGPTYKGQLPVYHAMSREYSTANDFDINVQEKEIEEYQNKINSKILLKKSKVNELLENIKNIKIYLKETVFEEFSDDGIINEQQQQRTTTLPLGKNNVGNKQGTVLLKNILEIQYFLEKRIMEEAEAKKNQDTQTEIQMYEMLDSTLLNLKGNVQK